MISIVLLQFKEVIFLTGLIGDIEQRNCHIAGDVVYHILFPEVRLATKNDYNNYYIIFRL